MQQQDSHAGGALRADAQRNQDAIVAAATQEVARVGPRASLEEIARLAGVGSATLYRRFPSRRSLMQAVFRDQVAELCDRADQLRGESSVGAALRRWLLEVADYAGSTRGLAESLELPVSDGTAAVVGSCEVLLLAAAEMLLSDAREGHAVREDVTASELLALVAAVSSIGGNQDGGRHARRLMALALDGVAPA